MSLILDVIVNDALRLRQLLNKMLDKKPPLVRTQDSLHIAKIVLVHVGTDHDKSTMSVASTE